MARILIQHEDTREGNDCTINDVIILLKEFDDAGNAFYYYSCLVSNTANR